MCTFSLLILIHELLITKIKKLFLLWKHNQSTSSVQNTAYMDNLIFIYLEVSKSYVKWLFYRICFIILKKKFLKFKGKKKWQFLLPVENHSIYRNISNVSLLQKTHFFFKKYKIYGFFFFRKKLFLSKTVNFCKKYNFFQ